MIEVKEQIEWVMNNFDFDKVHDYMIENNWVWFHCNGVPTVDKMKETAKGLLNRLDDPMEWVDYQCKDRIIGTGGFEAKMTMNDEVVSLRFCKDDCVCDECFNNEEDHTVNIELVRFEENLAEGSWMSSMINI